MTSTEDDARTAWRALKTEAYGDPDSVSDAQFLIDAFTFDGQDPTDLPGVLDAVLDVDSTFPVVLTTDTGDIIAFCVHHEHVTWGILATSNADARRRDLPRGQHGDPATAIDDALNAASSLH